jgi:ppGpp synthetase/RelA/SpoT-type nucleotidyltranferase
MLSNTKIRNIGDSIRQTNGQLDSPLIAELEDFRVSFKPALSRIYNSLDDLSQSYKNSIVTFRIKRFESIIKKLERLPKMDLDRMWDIGGCRVIFQSKRDVYSFFRQLLKEFNVVKINDYFEKPKIDGYKSLHIYIRCEKTNKIIEIQLRNRDSHDWATLVEITDIVYDDNLKETIADTPRKRLLKLLSEINSLDWTEKIELQRLIRQEKYFRNLMEMFNRNYISVRKNWTLIEDNRNNTYILIAASKTKIPSIKTFSSFSEAEAEYFKEYDFHSTENRVLTHIQNPSFEKVMIAYSNYILSYHRFVELYFTIKEGLILESIENIQIRYYAKYLNEYFEALSLYFRNVVSEIDSLKDSAEGKASQKHYEWIEDVIADNRRQKKRSDKFRGRLVYNLQKSNIFFRWLMIIIMQIIGKKFDDRRLV